MTDQPSHIACNTNIIAAFVPQPQTIVIQGNDGPLVTLNLTDGSLEYGPGYTPDEAARRFWDAISHYMPSSADRRVRALEAEVAAARKFAGEMRDFCSPHGVAVDYADRLVEAMNRAKGTQA